MRKQVSQKQTPRRKFPQLLLPAHPLDLAGLSMDFSVDGHPRRQCCITYATLPPCMHPIEAKTRLVSPRAKSPRQVLYSVQSRWFLGDAATTRVRSRVSRCSERAVVQRLSARESREGREGAGNPEGYVWILPEACSIGRGRLGGGSADSGGT